MFGRSLDDEVGGWRLRRAQFRPDARVGRLQYAIRQTGSVLADFGRKGTGPRRIHAVVDKVSGKSRVVETARAPDW